MDFVLNQEDLTQPFEVVRTAILHRYYTIKKNIEFRAMYKDEYELTFEGMKEKYKELVSMKDDLRTGEHIKKQEEGTKKMSIMKEIK